MFNYINYFYSYVSIIIIFNILYEQSTFFY